MIDRRITDEVWLALDQAHAALKRDGHTSNPNILDCGCCYAVYLLENAMIVYKERARVQEEKENTSGSNC